MGFFSHRKGLKQVKDSMQLASIDDDLKNKLWSSLFIHIFHKRNGMLRHNHSLFNLTNEFWFSYINRPIDTVPTTPGRAIEFYREYFFTCSWNEIYDFIEFCIQNYPDKQAVANFTVHCNSVLESELSAYRIVGEEIMEITNDNEISEIVQALDNTDKMKAVNIHLTTALSLLSDRKEPDYRLSIKESVSAIESVCRLIAKEERKDLSMVLKDLQEPLKIKPSLKSGFNTLYGYTSTEEGIRHALLEEPSLGFDEAKFMLVSCSAFINYLISKSEKAGIKI